MSRDTRTTFGFFDAERRDGQVVPSVSAGLGRCLRIISGEEYADLAKDWYYLNHEDQQKVRRFESIATGIGLAKNKRNAELEVPEAAEDAESEQGELFE